MQDLAYDVSEGYEENNSKLKQKIRCLRLIASIEELNFECLIDSGSNATLISQAAFERIKNKTSVKVLPVSNTYLTGAFGKRSEKIKKQLYSLEMKTILLVVGNLVYDIILGIDWIVENRVIINGKEKAIRIDKLLINNEHVSFSNQFSCTYVHPKIEEYFPDHKDDARLSFGLGNGHRFVASDDSFEDEINNAMRECQHLKESERDYLRVYIQPENNND
ncbi:hypothetical protein TSAR_016669 [Trichomalopsis sarcophagae]|uniref:Uncharacterized protein n=1 Tax=Trichomalopsis sarcophagae TaxID=543379 RepID=A0A232EDI5_9HYME|nr:hypothetical protein TSAR_016669 [Trichomalopsis sarcophagae]